MKSAIARICLLMGLITAGPVKSDDLPFGADALRQLSTEATLVVRASQPGRQGSDSASADDPSRAKYAVFSITVAEILKGDTKLGAAIRIAFPESLTVQNISQLDNAILFLRPFKEANLKRSNIPDGGPVFIVISGRYGAIDGAPSNRKAAIKQYLDKGDSVLSWTDQYLNSADAFLQRSAIVDLYYERDQAEALRQLSAAVKSEAVLPSLKPVVIDALQESSAPNATQPLRDLAEDAKTQRSLRERAVKAVGQMPGGQDQLQQWRGSTDQVLSGAAIRNLQ
jgi:hypothetical protein